MEENGTDAVVVEATDAGVRFPNGTHALADVSLGLHAGELVAVVGPSGCGKSTLLRLLAGLLAPTSGRVRTPSSGIGIVFQQPTLLAWRTIVANVALPLELAGLRRGEATARALAQLACVGLGDAARAFPIELSGGMRMRAALARALAPEPRLLLLDEPFASVDELTRERLGEDVLGLRASRQITCLLVTHSVAEAIFLADRVLLMSSRPGRIVDEIVVPFGRTRDAALRGTAEFARIAAAVSARLREAV